jgi:3(or 17)beta-hydroxysteroid dehydrogenase
MQLVAERHGRLDIVMNNAGILGNASIEDVDLAAWDRVLAVNLTGVMLGCRAAIRLMRKNPGKPGGSIINISSTAAYGAIAHDVAYTATKSGVRMMTKSVAVWCAASGLNIRCNSIHPGPIDTSIHDERRRGAADPGEIDRFLAAIAPLGRIGTGDDIAAMAVFLASDESGFVTGGEFLVDGGTMAPHPGAFARSYFSKSP